MLILLQDAQVDRVADLIAAFKTHLEDCHAATNEFSSLSA
jgi:hypothetical protein